MFALECNNVIRWDKYGKYYLNEINMQVIDGQKILVCGKQGSGVEQFYRIIVGIDKPTSGQILINRTVAVIPMNFPYLDEITVKDYFLFCMNMQGLISKQTGADCIEFLKKTELYNKSTMKVQYLNCVEKCKLLVAMAFWKKPQIVIMNNCMYILNAEEKIQLKNFINQWLDERTSLICFSDDLDMPLEFDKKYILEEGRLRKVN